MQHFLSWAELQHIRVHEDASVQRSVLGGYGIVSHVPLSEDTIVLRVPKAAVFDLSSCMDHKKQLEQSDPGFNQLFNRFLGCSETISETTILRNYIWAYAGLASLTAVPFQPYLDILSKTDTFYSKMMRDESADTNSVSSHLDGASVVGSVSQAVRRDYDRAVTDDSLLTFPQALQLHHAVVSRVLEIPASENVTQIEDDGQDSRQNQDFFANVSLVPMLDFVNHSARNNAVFDVDLESNDIILRLCRPVASKEEITISYDPEPDLEHFFCTYGFVPEGASFRWEIEDLDQIASEIMGHKQEFRRMAKWLHVDPFIVIKEENSSENLDLGRLPLMFIEGLQYFPKWTHETADLQEEYQDEDISQIVEQLKHHESRSLYVPGETAFGVLHNDTYVSVPHVLHQIAPELGPLVSRTTAFLRRAAEHCLNKSSKRTQKQPESIAQFEAARRKFLLILTNLSDHDLSLAVEKALEQIGNAHI